MENLIRELQWRGMIQDVMPGTEEHLLKNMVTGYVGFDPTADSLHIGSLIPIILLKHLQDCGHKPIALVGGATGMVGDPSGKSEERKMLDEDQLLRNQAGIAAQLKKFLNFDASKRNGAEMANNYDWFGQMNFLDFIRDTGKHITVNYMMAKDSVKKRLEGTQGMSFTEFTYQLIQGYDYYYLFINKNCTLQMGGSDQWGNIVTGTELIRRKTGGVAFAFTCPLLKKADGGKFGKSEQGNVWLDATKTSPYHFYQFWLNASDEDAGNWIKIFTFLTEEQINAIIEDHAANAADRKLQKKLAEEITIFVHGEDALKNAQETTEKLFSKSNSAAEDLSEDDLINIEGIHRHELEASELTNGFDATNLLANTNICSSKGESKKIILNGGINVNRKKITDPSIKFFTSDLLHGKFLLVQKGKKNYYLVEFIK